MLPRPLFATEVNARNPLTLIDFRTTDLMRLGVSTEAACGKAQGRGAVAPLKTVSWQ